MSRLLWVIGLLGGGVMLLALFCCGGIALLLQPPRASAAAKLPFSLAEVPLPPFENRTGDTPSEGGVRLYEILISDGTDYREGGYYEKPGHGGVFSLYLPDAEHPPRSLPCVLITGAGSDLLSGMAIGDGDRPEHVPYAKAGFAVLAYELDGPSEGVGEIEDMQRAFTAFQASKAGLVNARNALEYVLRHVPEVDPARIYAAGHSSAATHALLFAEHEPRLAGVVAYAPAIDLPAWFGPRLLITSKLLPGSADFITQSSPSTHRSRLKCPVFLFHAEDDSTCDIGETRDFAGQLTAQGTDVTLKTVPTGGHYDSMIQEGIPAGIEWLAKRGAAR